MNFRRKDTPSVAAAKASFSTATAYRIESDPQPPSQKQTPRSSRRSDPLDGIFEKEVVPLLVESPAPVRLDSSTPELLDGGCERSLGFFRCTKPYLHRSTVSNRSGKVHETHRVAPENHLP